jgi:hypothetical protein
MSAFGWWSPGSYDGRVPDSRRAFYGIIVAATFVYSALIIGVLTLGPSGNAGAMFIGLGLLLFLAAIGAAFVKFGRGSATKQPRT